jgi:hypothetical protein
MAAPTPPSNITTTVNADDEIQISWDFDPTWFGFSGTDGTLGGFNDGRWYSSASVDHFEIQLTRNGYGWVSPAGGPQTVSHDGSTSYSATFGPEDSGGDSKNFYGSVGANSMFRFRVRAVNSDGSSSWAAGPKVYTTPIPPSDVYVTRPSANEIRLHATTSAEYVSGFTVRYREDTGSGYSGWTKFDWINAASETDDGTDPTVTGNSWSKTFTVGETYHDNWGSESIQEDARYQFRIETTTTTPNRDIWAIDSDILVTDYGNSGNVFFEDDFSSGDASDWDSNSIQTGGVTSTLHSDFSNGNQSPQLGGYAVEMGDAGFLVKNLGDLSGESDVHVRVKAQVASNDTASEDGELWWYDGSGWQRLKTWNWELDGQGWMEYHAEVPDSYLNTDNRVRIGRDGGGGTDWVAFDEIIVSDNLHEYTKPTTATNLTLSTSTIREIGATWTNNASFGDTTRLEYRKSSGSSLIDNGYLSGDAESDTITGLDDGEEYYVEVDVFIRQYRRNVKESFWHNSPKPSATVITVHPSPSNPSASAASDNSISLGWVDETNNEDGFRVYYREVGASSWTQYSSLSSNIESETIGSLNQDTEYEFKIESYTEHSTATSPTTSATTYLNESRSAASHSGPSNSSSIRVVDLTESVSSHGRTGNSDSIRVVGLIEEVSSHSAPIRSENSTLITLGASVTSSSTSASSSAKRVTDVGVGTASHAASGASSSIRVLDILASTLSMSAAGASSSERGSLNFEGRESDPSVSTGFSSSAIRVVALDEEVRSSASAAVSTSDRGPISYEGRESEPSFADRFESDAIRVIDLKESVSSHSKRSGSFVYNDRTSLELLDHEISWSDGEAAWYTDWFQETKIIGTEDHLAIRSLVVDNAKEPAATVIVQYDSDGDGEVDAESDPIRLGRNQTVSKVTGVPIDEDGFYRLRISQYSGYNSLYAIDTGIVN